MKWRGTADREGRTVGDWEDRKLTNKWSLERSIVIKDALTPASLVHVLFTGHRQGPDFSTVG